jgi:hypothetical protein
VELPNLLTITDGMRVSPSPAAALSDPILPQRQRWALLAYPSIRFSASCRSSCRRQAVVPLARMTMTRRYTKTTVSPALSSRYSSP